MTQISWSPVQIAYKQAFQATLAAGWEKEGDLATTSPEFEYLHRKSRCKMLIGGGDISNDVFTLNWHMFFNAYLHLHSFLLLADWQKADSSVDGGVTGELEVEFKF